MAFTAESFSMTALSPVFEYEKQLDLITNANHHIIQRMLGTETLQSVAF